MLSVQRGRIRRVDAAAGFALFDTALGRCAIGWNDDGRVVASSLPGSDDRATTSRFAAAGPADPPEQIAHAVAGVVALFGGDAVDLREVPVDLDDVAEFDCAVYAVARTITVGSTMTYGEVARALGDPGAARSVGQALGRNPVPVIVPCHRVVAAGGHIGGFSAPGGAATKRRMLAIEARHTPGTLAVFGT